MTYKRKRYLIDGELSKGTLRMRRWREKQRVAQQEKGLHLFSVAEVGHQVADEHVPLVEVSRPRNLCEQGHPAMSTFVPPSEALENLNDCIAQQQPEVCGYECYCEREVAPRGETEDPVQIIREEPALEKLLPLCSHTKCTPDDIMLMCLSLGFRHNLSWVAVEDVLKMFNAVYDRKVINTTKNSLIKRLFVGKDNTKVAFHYYCTSCCRYVSEVGHSDEKVVCECGNQLSGKEKSSYFASISLTDQIKSLFESNERLAERAMTYRFSRAKVNDAALEDIYDGSEYKKLASPGQILSSAHNFSYSFFTDGVGRQKKGFWPIYVTVNELPPEDRKSNILLVGLYYADGAPNLKMFLKPFVDEANKLSQDGFDWNYKGNVINSKIIPLLCICDSDARYKLLNMKSHKSFYGCTYCYQIQRHTANRLKYVITNVKLQERTKESHYQDILLAIQNQNRALKDRHGRGVLGVSSVAYLNFFNQSRCMPVDYMHAILLGVFKSYFENLFMDKFKKFWVDEDSFTVEDIQSAIDERLLMIKSPTCITRTPHSISDWGNWKANEWRAFLLFYFLPCLKGILKDQQLEHLALLSVATCMLLQKSVTETETYEAHRLLQEFTLRYQKYFGEEFMYYNIHLLIHVVPGVIRWGPLFTHNAFMYESFNRNLLQLKKNPHRVVKEVCSKYVIFRGLPRLLETLGNETALNYCEEILGQNVKKYIRHDSWAVLGAGNISCNLSNDEKTLLSSHFPNYICLFYKRMFYRGNRITTFEYTEGKKNNDSVISTTLGEILEVRAIFTLFDKTVRLLTRKVLLDDCDIVSRPYLRHLFTVSGYGELKLIEPKEIRGPCILMVTLKGTYLSKMPYGCYGD